MGQHKASRRIGWNLQQTGDVLAASEGYLQGLRLDHSASRPELTAS
jgi:hypothetical protein